MPREKPHPRTPLYLSDDPLAREWTDIGAIARARFPNDQEKALRLHRALNDAVACGRLTPLDMRGLRLVGPVVSSPVVGRAEVTAWFQEQGDWPLPDDVPLSAWFEKMGEGADYGAPRRRRDALTIAMEAGLSVLTRRLGRPPKKGELWDYLQTEDATETVQGLDQAGNLLWDDDVHDGSQVVTFEMFRKRLARLTPRAGTPGR